MSIMYMHGEARKDVPRVPYHRPAANQNQLTVLLPTTVAQGQDIDTFLTTHCRPIRIKIEGKEKE